MKKEIFLILILIILLGTGSFADTEYNLEFHILDGDVFEPEDLGDFSTEIKKFLKIEHSAYEGLEVDNTTTSIILDTKKKLSPKDFKDFEPILLQTYDAKNDVLNKEKLISYTKDPIKDSRLLFLLTTTDEDKAIWNDLPFGTVYSTIYNLYETSEGTKVDYINIAITKHNSNEEYSNAVSREAYINTGIINREKEEDLKDIDEMIVEETEDTLKETKEVEEIEEVEEVEKIEEKEEEKKQENQVEKSEEDTTTLEVVQEDSEIVKKKEKEEVGEEEKSSPQSSIFSFIINMLVLGFAGLVIYFKFFRRSNND